MARYLYMVLLSSVLSEICHGAVPTFYKDVWPIVRNKCVVCHSESGVSFSMEKPETTLSFGPAITQAVRQERMPPWLAAAGHQYYVDDYSLTPEQKETFSAWEQSGFKEGHRNDLNSTTKSEQRSVRFDHDYKFLVNEGKPFLPDQTRKDDYRCFVIEWPYKKETYITGLKVRPGNLKVAHHMVAFVAEPGVSGLVREQDKIESDRPGYRCYGGVVADRLGDKTNRKKFEARYPDGVKRINDQSFWLAHWAPGMGNYDFPAETGILVRPGALLVLQMHFYSAFAPGESDKNTAVFVKVRDKVKKPAIFFPVSNTPWFQGSENKSMVIHPGKPATYENSFDFTTIAGASARIAGIDPERIRALELHSANLHMHSFGTGGGTYFYDQNGRKEILLNIPRWDLNWQRDFTLVKPRMIYPEHFKSSRLSVECHYTNPGADPVYGGYGSDDEMCMNFSYIAMQLK